MRTSRPLARIFAVVSVSAMIVSTAIMASANDGRTFSATATPSIISPDVPSTVTFLVTNTSAAASGQSKTIGAVGFSVPPGATVAGESGFITRATSLAPGESQSFSFTVTAPCASSPYVWGVMAAKSNNFSGDGNRFALSGGSRTTSIPCPGDDTTTTTVAGPGEPTTTTTVAGPQEPTTTTTVAGPQEPTTTTTTTTTTTLAPVPQFTPRPYYTTTWDVIEPCVGWSCETEPLELGNTIGKLYGDQAANVLFLSLRSSDEVPDFCGSDFQAKSETVIFDVWGYEAEKIVEITIVGIGNDDEVDADEYEVCFGGEEPFTQKDDRGPAVFGDGLWFGLLPDCEDANGDGWPGPEFSFWHDEFALGGGTYGPAPCVAWRELDEETGDLTVIVLAPPGDPRIKIG